MQNDGSASDQQLSLPLAVPGDEPAVGNRGDSGSIHLSPLMVRVLSRDNLSRALKQVRRNKGAPGIDGMSVEALADYLRERRYGVSSCIVSFWPIDYSPAYGRASL